MKLLYLFLLLLLVPVVVGDNGGAPSGGGGGGGTIDTDSWCADYCREGWEILESNCNFLIKEAVKEESRKGNRRLSLLVVAIGLGYYYWKRKKNKPKTVGDVYDFMTKHDLEPEDKSTVKMKREVVSEQLDRVKELEEEVKKLKSNEQDKMVNKMFD